MRQLGAAALFVLLSLVVMALIQYFGQPVGDTTPGDWIINVIESAIWYAVMGGFIVLFATYLWRGRG
jgi:hypothetical protein